MLIVIAFSIFKLINRPQMTIIVKYKDAPPISYSIFNRTIDAHYRGCKVGQVSKVNLSKDQKCVEFHLDIYYKNLKLPKNTPILLRTENFYGKKYLDIHYPEAPSLELLSNGDCIEGLELYEGLDEYLIEEFKIGRARNFLTNLSSIIEILEKTLKKNENEKCITQSVSDAAIVLKNLREIIDDPKVKKEIHKTINNAPKSINQTLENIETMNEHMDKMTELMPEMNQSILKSNSLLNESNNNLCSINKKVPEIPQSLVKNADKLIVRTDCFESEMSKILSKRFLIFRLIFGNPGKSFKNCSKKECDCSNSIFSD